jgi:hypothetical protein
MLTELTLINWLVMELKNEREEESASMLKYQTLNILMEHVLGK